MNLSPCRAGRAHRSALGEILERQAVVDATSGKAAFLSHTLDCVQCSVFFEVRHPGFTEAALWWLVRQGS